MARKIKLKKKKFICLRLYLVVPHVVLLLPSPPMQLWQSASAYASAGGETRGHLDIAALRLAMVTVLGRAVRESEAESRLLSVRKRTFPRQLKVSS